MIVVREEQAGDVAAIRVVHERAFPQHAEADLVDTLRANGAVTLSLVAVLDDAVVGHILFSPATIEGEHGVAPAVGLAPMAVLPEHQRQGIGSALVAAGLAQLRASEHGLVIVLGHPEYYPRFGFEPARRLGITCTFDVPDEVFMAQELRRGACLAGGGLARYRPELDGV